VFDGIDWCRRVYGLKTHVTRQEESAGEHTRSRPAVTDGLVSPPEAAGLGIDWNWDAIADRRVT
jgi:L-alanine-DL-glutamate epimerase-like enolase superfamily enzyme